MRPAMASRVAALAGLAGVLLAACGGSASSSASATQAPKFDDCLVGTWTTVAWSKNSPANDEDIAYSGGAGEVFTISAKGAVTIDAHAVQTVVFVSAGQTFTGTIAGTGRGTLTIIAPGEFLYKPGDGDTLTTTSFGPDGVALGPPRPDSSFTAVYTCTPGQSFTFYKNSVNYMIDGSKVTLKAGNTSS